MLRKRIELLVPVALHVAADDGAVENVEGGEQRAVRAVALVVMGHGPGAALLHRQAGLGAVERLDLALLIDREDDGMSRRIDIKADDVPELLGKFRVLRQLERPHPMRRELMSFQDALHRTQAHPDRFGQFSAAPVRGLARRRSQRQIDHPLNGFARQRRLAGLARLVAQQPCNALRHEPCLPSPHHRLGLARTPHDLGGTAAIRRGEDDMGTPYVLLRRAAIGNNRLKPTAVRSRDLDNNSCSHAKSFDLLRPIWELSE